MIGIIGAMDSEVKHLTGCLENSKTSVFSGMTFYEGKLNNKEVVVVKSGIGKVNAALCAQILILNFKVDKIINTGIAGATGKGLRVFDFVVSTKAVYHDFDTTAFGYKIGQVPGLPEAFDADPELVKKAIEIFNTTAFAKEHSIQSGLIASGDQFISGGKKKDFIKETFSPACVEMEGAAIAHTCYINKVPFVIIRCMSDMADDDVEQTYSFNEETCAKASSEFIEAFVKLI